MGGTPAREAARERKRRRDRQRSGIDGLGGHDDSRHPFADRRVIEKSQHHFVGANVDVEAQRREMALEGVRRARDARHARWVAEHDRFEQRRATCQVVGLHRDELVSDPRRAALLECLEVGRGDAFCTGQGPSTTRTIPQPRGQARLNKMEAL